ncbi:MAG TPA: amidohydrolase, partial [Desulfobaccales bacterium]
MTADLLIYNALLLTLEPGAPPREAAYVTIRGPKIAAVGQAANPRDLPPARDRLDLQGALMLPGLVNTHTHAPMVWFRGLGDDLPLKKWLTEVIFPAEGGWLNEERVYAG